MEEIKKTLEDLRVLIEQGFAEIKSLISTSQLAPVKKKRKAGKYALFMKGCLTELKGKPGTQPEKFIECAKRYRERKKQGIL